MNVDPITQIAERRGELRDTDNVRAARTRQRLLDTFLGAVASEATPSVASLCRDAHVGRTTFYTHFASVEDLAVSVVADAFVAVAEADAVSRAEHARPREQIARESLGRVVAEVGRLRYVLLAGIRLGTRAGVLERLVEVVAKHTEAIIAVEVDDPELLRVWSRFLAAGIVHAAVDWIEQDDRVPEDRLVAGLFDILPTFLTWTPRE